MHTILHYFLLEHALSMEYPQTKTSSENIYKHGKNIQHFSNAPFLCLTFLNHPHYLALNSLYGYNHNPNHYQ